MSRSAGAIRWLRGPGAALLLTLAVALGFGLRWLAQHPSSHYSSDSYQYILITQGLAEGRGFDSGGSEHPDLSRSPLLPLAAAALTPLAGAETAVRLVVVLAGALMVVPLFLLARAGLGAGAALFTIPLAVTSCLMGASMRLLPTALLPCLLLAALAASDAAARRNRLALAAAAGALAGLAALSRAEGLIWPPLLAAWVALAVPASRPWRRRAWAALLLLAAAGAVYGPYFAWASLRLGRPDPSPGITYLARMRELSDRHGLRWLEGGHVPWQERSMGLLARDHRQLVLKQWFETSVPPEPDPAAINPPYSGPADAVSEEPNPADILRRRAGIAARNALQLQRVIRYGHFAPAVLVVLVLAGLPALLSPRRQRAAFLLLFGVLASLAPILSHLENRFLYTAFGLALLPAAAGWRLLDRHAARRGPWVRGAVGVGLLAMVAGAGWAHAGAMRRPAAVEEALSAAARAAASGPPGAIMSVQPAVAYRADRPFRLLPVAALPAVRDYAAAQGAAQVVLEGDRDLALRPDLEPLMADPPPAGFRLLLDRPDPRGGRLRVLTLDGADGP